MEVNKKELKITHFIPSLVLLLLFLNPYIEVQETSYQWLFMAAHYALFIGGFYLTYKILSGSSIWIVPSAFIVVFWHYPYFFALGASYLLFRGLNDFFFIFAGALAGIAVSKLSMLIKYSLLVLWMTVDTIFSLIFLFENPLYSNIAYNFSPYSPSQEFNTAIAMFIIMSIIIAYVFAGLIKDLVL